VLALNTVTIVAACGVDSATSSQSKPIIIPTIPSLTIDPGWGEVPTTYESSDEASTEFEVPTGTAGSSATSRCPDQHLQNPQAFFATQRLFKISVKDPTDHDRLVHFSGMETKHLRFLNYESQGATVSVATFELLIYWLSDDMKYQASPGARALMSCRNGTYTTLPGGTLVYTGLTSLIGLKPIQKHYQDESPIDCDDPLTEIVETECSPNGGGPNEVGIGGEMVDPGPWHGGGLASKWVCMVTYWYHYHTNGERHYYDASIDYCWLEEA